ncbi:MAG TPA: hypothetical protein VJW73_04590 [Gemmatimonadaceae bacterium]|nr:hypothetical protein [Gemmatimonadaceae bacterium]
MHLHRSTAGQGAVRSQETAAQRFYQDLLGGRQVWPTGRRAIGRLYFLFEQHIVEVGPVRSDVEPFELAVDSPHDVAARCWDAGYTVRLLASEPRGALAVVDPFGRAIQLRSRRPSAALGYVAGQAG